MKLYRCFIGVLLVFFITLAVLYLGTMYNERRSIEEGILIFYLEGGTDIGIGHGLC